MPKDNSKTSNQETKFEVNFTMDKEKAAVDNPVS
jgi:hypothetical protein